MPLIFFSGGGGGGGFISFRGMIKYKGVYILKLSNWSFPDILTHQVEPPQPLEAPPGAPDW